MLPSSSTYLYFLLSLLVNLTFSSPRPLLLHVEVKKTGLIRRGETCFQASRHSRNKWKHHSTMPPIWTAHTSTVPSTHVKKTSSTLSMTPMQTLKPAAVSLLEAGKALARYGELMIDVSTTTTSYLGFSWKAFQMGDKDGGDTVTQQLSPYIAAIGACIRTAGDCIAQAAALMRFKTGHELVVVELRDASFCLCHQLGDDYSVESRGDKKLNASSRMGATSAWAKAEEALMDIDRMIQDTNKDAVDWDRAKAVMGMCVIQKKMIFYR